MELPIPFDGVVHELRFAEGTTVDVGEVIITVVWRRGARTPRSGRCSRPGAGRGRRPHEAPLATIFGTGGAAACAVEAKAPLASTAPAVSATVLMMVTRLMRLIPIFN
ncbi:hypothetical protein SMICM17S_06785 [Streptomyces microflavus]